MAIPIYFTGVRDGEIIEGVGKQCKGSIAQIFFNYPPSRTILNEKIIIRDGLNSYDFFKDMSFSERIEWFEKNATPDDDLYLSDCNLKIKFLKIDGEYMTKSLDFHIKDILNKELDMKDVYNLFPKKVGSKARRHTLVFRPGNWVLRLPLERKSYEGIYWQNGIKKGKIDHYIEANPPIAYQEEDIYDPWDLVKVDNVMEIREKLSFFTPSMFKSLLQKIIRMRAMSVSKWKAEDLAVVTFMMLYTHPGALVPNIQRFVKGSESAFKRLAVSILEDSYSSSSITNLLAASLICREKDNCISKEFLRETLEIVKESVNSDKYYKYKITPRPISEELNPWNISYNYLSQLKSFQTDIDMLSSIIENNGEYLVSNYPRVDMNIYHGMDHHCYPEIAYYIPYTEMSIPDIFRRIWDEVSGYNNRKREFLKFPEDISLAQEAVWTLLSLKQKIIREKTSKFSLQSYTLDDEILLGMIGPIELKHKGNTYLCFNNHVISKPSRTKKYSDVEEEEEILSLAREKSNEGILLRPPSYLNRFKDTKYVYPNILVKDDKEVRWKDARRLNFNLKYHKKIEHNSLNAILYSGEGIEENNDWKKILANQDSKILRRFIYHTKNKTSIIKLGKISRDGSGQDYWVPSEDIAVAFLLREFCQCYPGILQLNKDGFRVLNPLFYSLVNINIRYPPNKWEYSIFERELWPHQINAINELIKRDSQANIIFMTVGLGKTSIINFYIKYLIENNKMPKYCIYTYPPSAEDSISKELSNYHQHFLDGRSQPKKSIIPKASHINFIKHDHLRLIDLSEYSDCLLIIDEFHKTLNPTQRTSKALELARLSRKFIAMTGTLIQNGENAFSELTPWLSSLCNFELNEHNFWCGIDKMIKYRKKLDIELKYIDKEVDMKEEEKEEYFKLVGKNLGGHGETDFHKAVNYCYSVVKDHMIEIVLEILNKEVGVFLIAKDKKSQEEMGDILRSKGIVCHLILKDNSITLTSDMDSDVRVVITTINQSEGYTLTRFKTMITGVYFSNECSRSQLVGRLNRIGQKSKFIDIYTFHTGILSYINEKYGSARSLADMFNKFCKDV